MLSLPPALLTFMRFALVGALTALIYFLAFWLTFTLWHWPSLAALSLSYGLSTLFHFLANQRFTFGVGFRPRRVVRYGLLWLLNYGVTVAIVSLCETVLGLSPYVGICLSVGITMLISFNVARHWVYDA